jgi:hypothetical protein
MGSVMNCYYSDQSDKTKEKECPKSDDKKHDWEKFQWHSPSRYEVCKFCKETCYYK